jgi:ankyrin repeat protein
MPLHVAADESPKHGAAFNSRAGRNSCAALLIRAGGAGVNFQTGNGETPLHMAATWNNTALVKLLLEHGADPNLRNSAGATPLHLAAAKPDGAAVVRLLLEHGADASLRDGAGATPMDQALRFNAEAERAIRERIKR